MHAPGMHSFLVYWLIYFGTTGPGPDGLWYQNKSVNKPQALMHAQVSNVGRQKYNTKDVNNFLLVIEYG